MPGSDLRNLRRVSDRSRGDLVAAVLFIRLALRFRGILYIMFLPWQRMHALLMSSPPKARLPL